jgi:hypothetical protein
LPYWTYDTTLDTAYAGQGGRSRTVVHTTTDSKGNVRTHTTTVIDWYPIAGNSHLDFDDYRVSATPHVDMTLLKNIGTYSTKYLNKYSPAFLSGFLAQRYDVGVGEGWTSAESGMKSNMESHIQREAGYQHYRGMSYDHRFGGVKFKHILLPIWLSSYTYKGKIYSFMVNGETGRVSGRAPVSVWKILAAVALGLAIIGGIIALVTIFGEGGDAGGSYYYY